MIRTESNMFPFLCTDYVNYFVLHTILFFILPQLQHELRAQAVFFFLRCIINEGRNTYCISLISDSHTTLPGVMHHYTNRCLLATVLTRRCILMRQSVFIFLRKYWFTRESSEVVKGVISGGDTGHDHVVSHQTAGVVSSVCIGKWLESKKMMIIYSWKWSCKQAK